MKKDKPFDCVKLMREIRDQMSEEMKGMTCEEQLEYIAKKSRVEKRRSSEADEA